MTKTISTFFVAFLCGIAGFCQCVNNQTYSLDPLPQDGEYQAGETVEICGSFTFTSGGAIWVHGIIPVIPPGWDISTLSYTPPASCSGTGSWGWYESSSGTAYTAGTYGPGFFYETDGDNNPGNNYGDNCSSGQVISFCITLTTSNDPDLNGNSLTIDFIITGDNLSGAWGSSSCGEGFINGPDIILNTCSGEDISIEVCETSSAFDLFSSFESTPAGGTWTNPLGNITSGIFNPGTSSDGIYTFAFDTGECSAESTVSVTTVSALSAGTGQNIEVCEGESAFNLFDHIIGGDTGGGWTDPDGNPVSGIFTPGVSTPGSYTYTVGEGSACPQSQTVVSVSVTPVPNAGNNGAIALCESDPQVDLFNFLMNSPQPGGTWTDPAGNAHSGMLSPSSDLPGDYTYSLGTAPCNATAVVAVNIVELPYAGENTTVSVCEDGVTLNLFLLLTGADNTGFWANPEGAGFDGIFEPGVDPVGDYVYQVGGMACNDVAVVSVSLADTPSGTITANTTYCQNTTTEITFTLDGTAPFDVTYTVNGTEYSLDNISSGHTETITGTGNLEVELISVSDNSTSGCTGSGNSIIIQMAPTPSASISGGGGICAGESGEIYFNLSGNGPFDVTYTDGSNEFLLSDILDGYAETVTPTENTTYTLVSVADNSDASCEGNVSGSAGFTVNEIPSGSISGSADICLGESTALIFDLEGNGPFDVVYSDGANNFNLFGINDGHTIDVSPLYLSFYHLISIVSQGNPDCPGNVSGMATVSVSAPPVYNNLSVSCDDVNETYQVTFQINGGDAGSYSVTGDSGELVGNIFTSDNIPSGESYAFFIDDDNNCGPVEISGTHICECITSAGTMQDEEIEVCISETAQSIHLGNAVLDANDALIFVLHDNSGDELGEIFAENTTPEFTYTSSLTLGTTYYISAVAGNALGNSVDFSSSCLSVSPGTPIIFLPGPYAEFLIESTGFCPGDSTEISITLLGNAPIEIEYAIDGVVAGSFETTNLISSIIASEPGIYTISTLADETCTTTVDDSVEVIAYETPTATIADAAVCEGLGGGPEINLTGTAPWTLSYTINGTAPETIVIDSTPFILDAESPGTYEIVALSDANCTGVGMGTAEVNFHAPPTASISGGGQICSGELAEVTFEGNGSGTVMVSYTVDGTAEETIEIENDQFVLQTDVPGVYAITSVSDDFCTDSGDGSTAEVIVNPIPDAEINLGASTICAGDSTLLTITPTGNGPFEIIYSLGDELIIAENSIGISNYISPDIETEISLISITDNSNPVCGQELSGTVVAHVLPVPDAPELTDIFRCNNDSFPQIGISTEANLSYSWTPQQGLSNPNISNPVLTLENNTSDEITQTYTLTVNNGVCTAASSMDVTIHPEPQVNFSYSPDPVSTEATAVNFYNHTPGVNHYTWLVDSNSVSTSTNMIYKFPDGVERKYMVTLIAENLQTGCRASTTKPVDVLGELILYIPNAFSPDGDGINELFGPVIQNYRPAQYEFTIYNRQGELIFQSTSPDVKWDGSDPGQTHYVQTSVYVWVLRTADNFSSATKEQSGSVTVIR